MKIGELLKKAQKEHLRTELEVFLSYLLGVDRSLVLSKTEEEIPVEYLSALQQGWTVLKQGKPVAYLTNSKEFHGFSLYVDERVLIPRPETEGLVELALEKGDQIDEKLRVLELGTGSGAISLALKKSRPNWDITATDISRDALEVANKNFIQYQADVQLIYSDLLGVVPSKKYDLLVTNLPYIGTEKFNFLSPEVEKFEPHLALFGGEDGLGLYARLFEQIEEGVWPFKFILGEIGFAQGPSLQELAQKSLPNYSCEIKQDLSGLDRYFVMKSKKRDL